MTKHHDCSKTLLRLGLGALALGALCASTQAQTVVDYDASSGLFPEAPCWALSDTADPEDPQLLNGKLVIATSADGENMTYGWGATLIFPSTMVFEVRMKLDTGSAATIARAPAVVGFTLAPHVGNLLQIDTDRIFLMASNTMPGATAFVDTDDQFHTYRIEVTGTTAGSLVEVYYDDEPTPRLQDDLTDDPNITSSAPRLFFGEGSLFATGVSQWETVSHNAGPETCCGQANSCGNNEELGSVGLATGGTYDANSGANWDITLSGVPAAPSPGLLIYAFGPSNPVLPVQTAFGNLCLGTFFRASATVTVPDATTGGCASPSQYSFSNWGAFVDNNKAAGINGFSAGGVDEVWIQAWHRDPPNPGTANLSKIAGPFFVMP